MYTTESQIIRGLAASYVFISLEASRIDYISSVLRSHSGSWFFNSVASFPTTKSHAKRWNVDGSSTSEVTQRQRSSKSCQTRSEINEFRTSAQPSARYFPHTHVIITQDPKYWPKKLESRSRRANKHDIYLALLLYFIDAPPSTRCTEGM